MIFADHFKEARARGRRVRVVDIQRAVADHFMLSAEDFLGTSKVRALARPRQIAMYMARGLTPRSYPEIGKLFGRDHATIVHGVRQIDALVSDDAELYDTIVAITDKVTAGG